MYFVQTIASITPNEGELVSIKSSDPDLASVILACSALPLVSRKIK